MRAGRLNKRISVISPRTTRFTIRYSTVSITPSNLIVYNGSTYDIQGIVNTDERNRELVIMARIAT